ncbi:hypothetical protein ARMSODRAFT_983328 [Armillaria solidipes]|uniref:Uncharacterized protein n=1 Tax=Armillaria solidipes TaxID=1076256 RepID=A0A2H3AMW1_9AGAR|nr:hypothetical protein ARMSODRAFT_983328 [Armillaria solidipes]
MPSSSTVSAGALILQANNGGIVSGILISICLETNRTSACFHEHFCCTISAAKSAVVALYQRSRLPGERGTSVRDMEEEKDNLDYEPLSRNKERVPGSREKELESRS